MKPFSILSCALLVSIPQLSTAADCAITGPASPPVPAVAAVFKPGIAIDIIGSAGGPGFRSFRLEWARAIKPALGWSDTGITLAGGGASPVADALLGTWNSTSLTQADFYSIRLLVDNTSATNEARTYVYFEPDLYSTNWPQWLDQAPGNNSLLPARDAAGQTRLALVNPTYLSTAVPSRLWLFALDGSSLTTNELDHASLMQPAVADLDGAPGDEIIVAEWNQLRVFRPDGSSYVLTLPIKANLQDTLVTLADLDGDGQPEALALGSNLGNSDGWVCAWNTNGQMFSPNYPLYVPDANFSLRTLDRARIIRADLDADGKPELLIIAGDSDSSFSLRIFRADGTPADWPLNVLGGEFFQAVAGDLDRDGVPEIAVAYADAQGANRLQVYSAQGTPRPGWPVTVGSGTPMHVLMADLNRDGTNELIATAFAGLFVFRPNGSLFPGAWPVQGNGFQPFSVPVTADIDGDGFPEILAVRGNTVFTSPSYKDITLVAYRTNGTLARSWRLFGANGNQPTVDGPPLVGDFDGSGNVQIALNYRIITGGGTSGYLHEGVVSVLRLSAPYRPDHRDWPMYFHDAQNSSTAFLPAKLHLATSGANLALSWPLQPDPAVVQYCDDLKTNRWSQLPDPPTLSNGLNTVTIGATNSYRSFRLQYP